MQESTVQSPIIHLEFSQNLSIFLRLLIPSLKHIVQQREVHIEKKSERGDRFSAAYQHWLEQNTHGTGDVLEKML